MTETLERVQAIAEVVRGGAEDGERERRLEPKVVGAMREAGVFRMVMSTSFGGPELSPPEQLAVIEALSAFDGAAGWCGMINCDGGYATAYLDPEAAKQLYPTLDEPTVLVAAPRGAAVEVDGGYRVNGQWPFASGSSHAEVFWLNCLDMDGENMRPGSHGLPATRMVGLRRAEVEVLDTWHTTGLAATASNDVRVTEVVVPAERTFSIHEGEPVNAAPLYSWRWFFITKLAGVPLGVARAAIDEAIAVAETKLTMPTMQLAREDAVVQANVARARALVRSARAYVDDTLGRVWAVALGGDEPSPHDWADCRLAMTHAATSAKEAVTLVYEAMGTTGVYRRSPLDRHFRDVTTMAQHLVCQTKTYGAAGRRFLGLDPAMIGF
jgi:alkylation response protein AidB-like acyl-CoA dehydrogenase